MLQRELVTLIKALFRKYIRCLSVNCFKFMESHFPLCFFLCFFPFCPSTHTYSHTPSSLMEVEGESESYLHNIMNQDKIKKMLKELSPYDHVRHCSIN